MTPWRRRWVAANGVGELVGLGGGALVGVPAQLWLQERTAPLLAAVLAAVGFALVEGTVVGWAQWRVMRDRAPRLAARRWVGATVAGGLTAWLCVSVPLALFPPDQAGGSEPPLLAQLAVMAAAGLAAGPLLGGWQALALRPHVRHPLGWVWANARAWAVGLPVIQLAAGGIVGPTVAAADVALAALVLLVAGGLVGAVHGPTMDRLLDTRWHDLPAPRRLVGTI